MISSRETISAMRQLGGMTEAGVDILRAIRVLRTQTDNDRLISLYEQLEHQLRLGNSVADALEHEPEMFSAFAVSVVRQGEARGDLANSFYRIADYLQKEAELDAPEVKADGKSTFAPAPKVAAPGEVRLAARNVLLWLCGLSAVVTLVEFAASVGLVGKQWHFTVLAFAIFLFCAATFWKINATGDAAEEPESAPQSTPARQPKEATFD